MLRRNFLKIKSDTGKLARRLWGAISRSGFRPIRPDTDEEMGGESRKKRMSIILLERVSKKIQVLKPTRPTR